MIDAIDWLVPGVVGITFTTLGVLKLLGLYYGVVGGKDKPFTQQLCGT